MQISEVKLTDDKTQSHMNSFFHKTLNINYFLSSTAEYFNSFVFLWRDKKQKVSRGVWHPFCLIIH